MPYWMKMLGIGHDGCKDATSDCESKDCWLNPSMGVNQLAYKFVQAEGDLPFVPALEDELIDVEHLLAEPQTDKNLVDGVMYLDSEGIEKCLAIEDFPCTVDYYQKTDYGVLDTQPEQVEKQDSKYEFVDSMLQGDNEEENLHLTCDLSSSCPDYLLADGFEERSSQLDCGSSYGLSLRKVGSECHTQSVERDNDFGEISGLSTAITVLTESTSDQSTLFLDNMNMLELQDAFRSLFGRDTCVRDKHWLKRRILFGFQNLTEIGNVSSLVETGQPSIENEDCLTLIPGNDLSERVYNSCTNILDSRTLTVARGVANDGRSGEDPTAIPEDIRVGFEREHDNALITSKRLRKPTRRYIEETSDIESKCGNGRIKTSIISPGEQFLRDRTNNQPPSKMSRVVLAGSDIQVPCGLRARRGHPGKQTTLKWIDSEGSKEHVLRTVVPKISWASRLSESESQDDLLDNWTTATKCGMPRKHHRQWAISEVMKLIDGVSLYGVGRWTEIKRLSFSTSAYRTPVDLKDKWRNLLRASGAQMHGRNQVTPSQNHMSVAIPQSALRRVRELAIIHPYPRERKSKLPSAPATSPPSVPMRRPSAAVEGLHRSEVFHV